MVNIYAMKAICISKSAAESIKETKSAKGLRRGHPFSRANRAKALFEIETKLKIHFFDFYFKNHMAALITNKENKKTGQNIGALYLQLQTGILQKEITQSMQAKLIIN